jgi:phosphoglycerate dehydrogenase-like enzyme
MIIDERALAMLPDGACVINAGRGGLLDHDALLKELARGRLLGAGLDVFEHEPLKPSSPLLGRPDILATPHIAGVTTMSYRGIARRLADNVMRLHEGRPILNRVN